MKITKSKKIITPVLFFMILNIFYGVAAANQTSANSIGKIATSITIVTTYPYKAFLIFTKIKPNGWLIEINFILLALLFSFITLKLLSSIVSNKPETNYG